MTVRHTNVHSITARGKFHSLLTLSLPYAVHNGALFDRLQYYYYLCAVVRCVSTDTGTGVVSVRKSNFTQSHVNEIL